MSTVTHARMTPTALRILGTAEQLFYQHGLRAVGVERIADEADTTKKTIYDRFGSKDGLITACLQRRSDRWHAFVTAYIDEHHPAPGLPQVMGVLDALEQWMADNTRGCGFVNAYAELAGTGHEALPIIAAEKAWTRDLYVSLLSALAVPDADLRGRELAIVHEGAVVQMTAGGQADALAVARALQQRLVAEAVEAGLRPVGSHP